MKFPNCKQCLTYPICAQQLKQTLTEDHSYSFKPYSASLFNLRQKCSLLNNCIENQITNMMEIRIFLIDLLDLDISPNDIFVSYTY